MAYVRAALVPDESLCGIALHRALHRVVHPERIVVVILFNPLERLAVFFEDFLGEPALNAGSAVGESYNSNRDVENGLDLTGKEERCSAHPKYSAGIGVYPAACLADIVQGLV